jgi:hypothetical protein
VIRIADGISSHDLNLDIEFESRRRCSAHQENKKIPLQGVSANISRTNVPKSQHPKYYSG